MCRLLGYLGPALQLDKLLYKPEHSLIVQSYQPKEMTAGVLNADGFGLAWYHRQRDPHPFTYKNILPIWSDVNLPQLSRYVESGCVLAYVRSATPPLAVDLSNCQPFTHGQLSFIHNGFIRHFRQTLYRPLRDRLADEIYQRIHGTTDSEHIFALVTNELYERPDLPLEVALRNALTTLSELAQSHGTDFSANIILSQGRQLVASRFSQGAAPPTLYWLRDDPLYPDAVSIASEPLFEGNWQLCPEQSLLKVTENLEVEIEPVSTPAPFVT